MESHPTSSTDVAQGCALACVSCVCSRRTGPKDRQGELDGERERERDSGGTPLSRTLVACSASVLFEGSLRAALRGQIKDRVSCFDFRETVSVLKDRGVFPGFAEAALSNGKVVFTSLSGRYSNYKS